MEKVYQNLEEIKGNIVNHRLEGIVRINKTNWENNDIDQLNDEMTNELATKQFGYLLMDINYDQVGEDGEDVLIKVNVDASELEKDLD